LVAALIVALGIHERIYRQILGIEEIVNADLTLVSREQFARQYAEIIISNWQINNHWSEHVEVARRCLRNGMILFIAAAVFGGLNLLLAT